jgi:hypothetical protein
MIPKEDRPGGARDHHRDDADHRLADEITPDGSRITRPPVRLSLTIALDHLDAARLCCWVAPADRRCKSAVVAMNGLDHLDYEDVELLAEVHRIANEVVADVGSVPALGSADWWSAPHAGKVASLLVLAEARLIDDPHLIAAEQLRDVSKAISGELDWRAFARDHVTHTELQRRRAEVGPLCQHYTGGSVAWDTRSQETAA